VVRQFGRLLSPALADGPVGWIGGAGVQAPTRVPPRFKGPRFVVYGFVQHPWPAAVRLSAIGPAGAVSFEVPLDESAVAAGDIVATLAARARIRELEEGADWLATRGSRQKEKKASRARREIVELSTRYHLMSRETSFVAVERRETPLIGDMQLRRVPGALTTGWGGFDLWMLTTKYRAAPQPAMSAMRRLGYRVADSAFTIDRRLDVELPQILSEPFALRTDAGPQRSYSQRPPGLDFIATLQDADGSWWLTEQLAEVLGRELAEIQRALEGASGDQTLVSRAWATALALAWLQLNASEWQDEWQYLGAKARKWLDDVDARPRGGRTWIDLARRFLSP
jgi:hypothetical protein